MLHFYKCNSWLTMMITILFFTCNSLTWYPRSYSIQVDPTYQRKGLGGRLMHCAEAIAKSCGIPFCRLTVFKVRNRITFVNSIIILLSKCIRANSTIQLIQSLLVILMRIYPLFNPKVLLDKHVCYEILSKRVCE